MDFGYLFTSFNGRINRKPFWIGLIVLIIVDDGDHIRRFVSAHRVDRRADLPDPVGDIRPAILFLYPSTALMVKRLHDRNRPSYWAAFILVPMVLKSLTDLMGMTGDPLNQNALDYLLNIIVFVVSIWFFVELGCLRGTVGTNQYGPDPLGAIPAPAR